MVSLSIKLDPEPFCSFASLIKKKKKRGPENATFNYTLQSECCPMGPKLLFRLVGCPGWVPQTMSLKWIMRYSFGKAPLVPYQRNRIAPDGL